MSKTMRELEEWAKTLETMLKDCPCPSGVEIVYDAELGIVVVDMALFEESQADGFDMGVPGVYAMVSAYEAATHPTGKWDAEESE